MDETNTHWPSDLTEVKPVHCAVCTRGFLSVVGIEEHMEFHEGYCKCSDVEEIDDPSDTGKESAIYDEKKSEKLNDPANEIYDLPSSDTGKVAVTSNASKTQRLEDCADRIYSQLLSTSSEFQKFEPSSGPNSKADQMSSTALSEKDPLCIPPAYNSTNNDGCTENTVGEKQKPSFSPMENDGVKTVNQISDKSSQGPSSTKSQQNVSRSDDEKEPNNTVILSDNEETGIQSDPEDQSEHVCMICLATFTDPELLIQHLGPANNILCCCACGQFFKDKENYHKHCMDHLSLYEFKCGKCDKVFTSQDAFKRHTESHMNSNKKQNKIPTCQRSNTMKDIRVQENTDITPQYKPQRNTKKIQEREPKILYNYAKGEFICMLCDKKFTNRHGLSIHMRVHRIHNVKPLKTSMELQQKDTSPPKTIKCSVCERCFLTKGGLAKHMQVHNNRQYSSPQCQKSSKDEISCSVPIQNCQKAKQCFPCPCSKCDVAQGSKPDCFKEGSHQNAEMKKCYQIDQSESASNVDPTSFKVGESNPQTQQQTVADLPSKQSSFLKDHKNLQYFCPQCRKSFKNKISLSVHVQNCQKLQRYFPCSKCKVVSGSRRGLAQHMRWHKRLSMGGSDKDKNKKCFEIGQSNSTSQVSQNSSGGSETDANYQQNCLQGDKGNSCSVVTRSNEDGIENNVTYFPCSKCKLVFRSKVGLNQHMCKGNCHHAEGIELEIPAASDAMSSKDSETNYTSTMEKSEYKCRFCLTIFHLASSLKKHLGPINKVWSCCICDATFTHRHVAYKHRSRHLPTKKWKCLDCGKWLRGKQGLTRHRQNHRDKGQKWPCEQCNKMFSFKATLAYHIRNSHEMKHECTICGKVLSDKFILEAHIASHTGKLPYLCTYCGKSYSREAVLKKHVRRLHTNDKPCKCELCPKRFLEPSQLKTHMRKHTGQKTETCPECGKGLSGKVSLKMHLKTHTGEKPHSCHLCGKKFLIKPALSAHIRVHTGERPFKCDYCGKRFREVHHMRSHRAIHTGHRPHVCDVCSKSFIDLGKLKLHKLTHTGEKPFTCADCGAGFIRKKHLIEHANTCKRQTLVLRKSTREKKATATKEASDLIC